MKDVNEILKTLPVNSSKGDKPTVNSNTVNCSDKNFTQKLEDLLQEENLDSEGKALLFAQELDDKKSLAWYKLLIREHDNTKLFEALSYVKHAYREGKIKTTRAHYFRGILIRWKFKVKFS